MKCIFLKGRNIDYYFLHINLEKLKLKVNTRNTYLQIKLYFL